MMRRAIIAAMVGTLCVPAVASAHAMLERSGPMVGSTVHVAPAAITLRFSEAIEPALSTLSVTHGNGAAVALAAPIATEHGAVLVAAVRGVMTTGVYRVHWRVVSVDTHVTQGDFSFRIAP
jgi:methionine-rich copper-binding protein CopC